MDETPDRPVVATRGLRKVYPDGTVALEGLDLEVPRGQFCVILGPSGSGKSTLLRVINGLVAPSAGAIAVENIALDRRNLRRVRRRVGTIHQAFNLSGRLPVLLNVCAGAAGSLPTWRVVAKVFPPDLQRRACALLERVGLIEGQLYRRANQLSGGQQQRVGIARAFVLEPAVVLADEPVASLDPETSRDILTLLRDASRERGCTVLCSLHQIDLAREFADRIVGISAGRMVFDGHPDELDDATLDRIYPRRDSSATEVPEAREASATPEAATQRPLLEPSHA